MIETLAAALHGTGLVLGGVAAVRDTDAIPTQYRSLLLLSPDEPAFWDIFVTSPEYRDGGPDPLDRWSRRVIDAIAENLGALPLYPFGGPPHRPFLDWALRSGRAFASPVGLLVHERAGLFVSYRGALAVTDALPASSGTAPCPSCDAPCAGACPVGALTPAGYDVASCKAHLRTPAGQECRSGGCLVRRACPVGTGLRLPAQSAFHMEAFL